MTVLPVTKGYETSEEIINEAELSHGSSALFCSVSQILSTSMRHTKMWHWWLKRFLLE